MSAWLEACLEAGQMVMHGSGVRIRKTGTSYTVESLYTDNYVFDCPEAAVRVAGRLARYTNVPVPHVDSAPSVKIPVAQNGIIDAEWEDTGW